MNDLTVMCLGAPVRRLQAQEVQELDHEVRELAKRMFTTTYRAGGQGLTAPQVGVSMRPLASVSCCEPPLPDP